jgi:hypothetical protein
MWAGSYSKQQAATADSSDRNKGCITMVLLGKSTTNLVGVRKKKTLLTTWIFFSIFVHQNSHVAEKEKKVRATDLTESHSHP